MKVKQAVIDLGTNSVKCLAVDCESGTVILQASVVTKLGEELAGTGKLGKAAIERTLRVVSDMVQNLRRQDIARIRIIGTMALRMASDTPEIIKQIQEACAITPEILSAAEEAGLSFEAAVSESHMQPALVTDIGGGSTELTLGSPEQISWSHSLRLGAVTLSREFLPHDPVLPREVERLKTHITKTLSTITPPSEPVTMIGIGGSLCSLAAIAHGMATYDSSLVHGSKLSLRQLETLSDRLSTLSICEKEKIPGLQKGRADTILAGALIAGELLRYFHQPELLICTRGWRHTLVCS